MLALRFVALLVILLLVPFGSSTREASACGQSDLGPLAQSDVRLGMVIDGGATTQHDASLGHCADGWLAASAKQLVRQIGTDAFAPADTPVILGERLPPEVGPPRT